MLQSSKKEMIIIIACGLAAGLFGALLVKFGNPKNMGFCIACFIRDTAGGLGLHTAAKVQYIRPEIIGLVLGAFGMSFFRKEFKPRGGSSPVTRFIIAFFVMVGCLMFLGCPLRMTLRIAGGDLNAIVGLVGFVAGILAGIFFLNRGFSLKRAYPQNCAEGGALPLIQIVLLVLLVSAPAFIYFSTEGPGASHAPIIISLCAGLIVGGLAQLSRLCMVGGIRDFVLFREKRLLIGFLVLLAAAFVVNLCLGNFNPGFTDQPVAHNDGLWNFLGMVLVGYGCVLLGGCPLRQLVLSGEGNSDSAVTVLGLLIGAAFCHNFGLASAPEGVTSAGKIGVIIGLAVITIIAVVNSRSQKA